MATGRQDGRGAGGTTVRRGMMVLAVSAALAVTMAGCGKDDTPAVSSAQTPTSAATVPVVTTVAPKPTVATATNATLNATVMVDATGKTLYVFDRDTSTTSNCTGNCAGTWPALVLPSGTTAPVAGTGLSGLSAAPRPDDASKLQVAWNGKPLYTYSADVAPGDAKGDGVGGVWHAARAA